MTRSKKSRKPGVSSRSTPKIEKSDLSKPSDKRPKKKNGKIAGNRQLEADKKQHGNQHNPKAKDPRLGSKKPIALIKSGADAQPSAKKKTTKSQPIAAVRKVEPNEPLEQRLIELEQDERLLAIIAKQDDDIALSEPEIDYFNQLMDEHAQIQISLGISDEEEVPSADNSQPESEDDLWDKLDNSDFSNFDFEQDK